MLNSIVVLALIFFGIILESNACFNCQCGISQNIKIYEKSENIKVMGGKISNPIDWPFVVQIKSGAEKNVATCTATIIGEKWILSAAHCNVDVDDGDDDDDDITVTIHGKDYKSEKIIQHENFKTTKTTNMNDIMLIKLKEPLKFTTNITNVCLVRNITAINDEIGVAVGYGEIFENVKNINATKKEKLDIRDINFKGSAILHETPVTIRNMDYCNVSQDFAANRICAGGEMQGTTPGDSGGPLLVLRNGRWIQAGITSYGSYKPVLKDVNKIADMGIYTKISAYCDWIKNKTSGEVKCK